MNAVRSFVGIPRSQRMLRQPPGEEPARGSLVSERRQIPSDSEGNTGPWSQGRALRPTQNFFPGRIPFYKGAFKRALQFQRLKFGALRALMIT
jgi:hypothetical protein